MIAFVANDAAGYEVFMGRWTSRLAGPFLEFAGVGRDQPVLDVGCATGVITAAAADLGASAVGLDPSEATWTSLELSALVLTPALNWGTPITLGIRKPHLMPWCRHWRSTKFLMPHGLLRKCGA